MFQIQNVLLPLSLGEKTYFAHTYRGINRCFQIDGFDVFQNKI